MTNPTADDEIIAEAVRLTKAAKQGGYYTIEQVAASAASESLRLKAENWTPVDPVLLLAREAAAVARPEYKAALAHVNLDRLPTVQAALAMHALLSERGMLKS